ncbi:MAG: hypothetical protein RIT07_1086 [Bacteroidota bacterium]|jgi:hypothetical protein
MVVILPTKEFLQSKHQYYPAIFTIKWLKIAIFNSFISTLLQKIIKIRAILI